MCSNLDNWFNRSAASWSTLPPEVTSHTAAGLETSTRRRSSSKQTCVLRVTHAVGIKINLLLFGADRLAVMSLRILGEITKTRPPAVRVHHKNTP